MKNIFGQTLCSTDCPAWSKKYRICNAQMDYAGRGDMLCKIPDEYVLAIRKGDD